MVEADCNLHYCLLMKKKLYSLFSYCKLVAQYTQLLSNRSKQSHIQACNKCTQQNSGEIKIYHFHVKYIVGNQLSLGEIYFSIFLIKLIKRALLFH